MNKFIESKLLKESYETGPDELQNVIIVDTRELFKLPMENIIKRYDKYFNQIPYFKDVNIVYYPGSGSYVLEIMLYTNCNILICTDLVDPNFYIPLDSTKSFNDKVEFALEFSNTINDVSYFHNVYLKYIPKKVEEKIRSIEIKNNKCIIKFMYNKKLRTIITYLNVDANKFIPQEIKKHNIDLLVESGFVLSDNMRNIINPKMVLNETGNITKDLYQKYPFTRIIDLEYPYFYKDLIENDNIDYDNKIFNVHKALLLDKIEHRSFSLGSKKNLGNNKLHNSSPSRIDKFKTKYTEEQLDIVLNKSKNNRLII